MKKVLTAFLAALLLSSTAASAAIISYTGTTVGGQTWNRPVQGNPPSAPLSGVGTAVAFSVQAFVVSANGSYDIQSRAVSPAGWDNYTFLYAGSFNPTQPFVNVLIGNDDNPSIGFSGFTKNLSAGTTYILVTTGFDNNDQGSFNNTIRGTGDITLTDLPTPPVPEPMTMLLLGAGAVGVAVRRRRQ